MAYIEVRDDDRIRVAARTYDAHTLRRIVQQWEATRLDSGQNIVQIDGRGHSVEATRRALKLFDVARDILKDWQ